MIVAIHDHLLPVSWRSRPGDFISLMTLYESNYVGLRHLLPQLRTLTGVMISSVAQEPPLLLRMLERGPYTTSFALTYLFSTPAGTVNDPDLQVRVYHDAGLAETLGCGRWRHQPLASQANRHAHLGERWLRNIMLNKWIDYCLARGHQLAWRTQP